MQLGFAPRAEAQPRDLSAVSRYVIDSSSSKTVEEIRALSDADWMHIDVEVGNFGFREEAFWFQVKIPACTKPNEARTLEISYPLLDSIEFWSFAGSQEIAHTKTGDMRPAGERPYAHLYFGFPLNCAQDTVYIKVETEGVMQVPLKLWPENEFIVHSYVKELPQIFYFGAMLMMALYNVFILLSARRVSYLFYVLHILAQVSFQAGISGVGFRYVWPNLPLVNQYIIDKSITLMVTFALAFGVSYLDIKEFAPRLYRYVVRLCAFLGVYFFASFTLPNYMALRISILWVAVGISLGLYMIGKNVHAGRHTKFWSFSWILLLLGAIALIVTKTGLIPRIPLMENSMQMASVMISVFLSYAMADQLNSLRFDLTQSNSKLERTLASIETIVQEKTDNIRTIMNTLQQGILTIRSEQLLIEPEYSQATSQILAQDKLDGLRFEKIFLERLGLGADIRKRAVSALKISLYEDPLCFDLNAAQLPREAEIVTEGGPRSLVIDWVPITKDGLIDRYLIAFRDVTELKILQSTQKKQSEMLSKLQEIVDSDVHILRKFLHQAEHIAQYNLHLSPEARIGDEELQALFVYVHTLKGESRSLGLLELAENCHQLEDIFDGMRVEGASWNPELIIAGIERVKVSLLSYLQIYQENIEHLISENDVLLDQSVLNRWKDKLNVLMVQGRVEQEALRPILKEIYNILYLSFDAYKVKLQLKIRRLAFELGLLEPELHIEGELLYLQPNVVELLDRCFIHIFQNALVHGIEPQAVRRQRGKSPVGRIRVAIARRGFFVSLLIEDDGAGVDVHKIRQKAITMGLIQAEQSLDTETIRTCILRSGFSSTDVVTSYAGRGFGLDAIRHFISESEGQFKLQFGPEKDGFRAMQLVIELPAELFPEVFWQQSASEVA